MVDVGFTELLLIAVVGLVIIGPEMLPQVLRDSARWYTHLKRKFQDIKLEIEREIGVEEIKQQLRTEDILDQLEKDKEKLDRLNLSARSGNIKFLDGIMGSE